MRLSNRFGVQQGGFGRRLRSDICLPVLFAIFLLSFTAIYAPAQESPAPGTGTIQGKVLDSDVNPIEGARVAYHSRDTETGGQVRTAKDGTYTSEPLPPGLYTVRGDAQDYVASDTTVTLASGASVTADFKLDEINPGPIRLESRIRGTSADRLPIDGRDPLNPARLDPATQVVDGAVLD